MGRLLLYAFLGYIIYRVVKRIVRPKLSDSIRRNMESITEDGRRVIEGGELVPCVKCQTMVPQNVALTSKTRGEVVYYCSEECHQLAE